MGRTTVYNNIVDEEKWGLVNKENKILLQDFIDFKNSTNRANLTLKQYESMLKIFFVWNLENNNNKYFIDMKKREVIKYLNYLTNDLQSSPNRVATMKSALSSLSNFIEVVLDDEYPTYKNIIKVIETGAKTNIREKTILTEEDVDKILSALIECGQYQIACAFALAICSGARKSELARFKVEYFKPEYIIHDCLYETPEKITTKGRGKQGKKLHKYTLLDPFQKYFDLWMKERDKLGINSEWLFVVKCEDGYKQATDRSFTFWTNRISGILDKPFYFHSCRHYWTSHLKSKNIPDDIIQELQGWTSSEMVKVYNDNKAKDGFAKYFGKDGIKTVESNSIADL